MHEYFGLIGDGLLAHGLRFGGSQRATTFYVITSFHGAHVFTGVILLAITLRRVLRTRAGDRATADVTESVGLFWHFVDLVWILVFTFVYLIPAADGGDAMTQHEVWPRGDIGHGRRPRCRIRAGPTSSGSPCWRVDRGRDRRGLRARDLAARC